MYLVRPKNKKELYALKGVSKQQVLEQKLEKHVQVFLNAKVLKHIINNNDLARKNCSYICQLPIHYELHSDI